MAIDNLAYKQLVSLYGSANGYVHSRFSSQEISKEYGLDLKGRLRDGLWMYYVCLFIPIDEGLFSQPIMQQIGFTGINAVNYIRDAHPDITIGKDGVYRDMASYVREHDDGSLGLAFCATVNNETHFRKQTIRSRFEHAKKRVFSHRQMDKQFFEIMAVSEYQKDAKEDLLRMMYSTCSWHARLAEEHGVEYIPAQAIAAGDLISKKSWILGGLLNYANLNR
jgi:hypothetical protein